MTFQYEVIDHVQLAAPIGGEDEARKFFKDLLGFKEVEKPIALQKRGGVWFQAGRVHLHIGVEEHFIAAKKAHPAIRVKDIELMKAYLVKKNASFIVDEELPKANRFYMEDPFGNRIEFLQWLK